MSEETLQIAETRREAKGKGEKERYIHVNAAFQRTTRRDKKDFLNDQEPSLDFSNCPFSVWVDLVIESIFLKLFVSTLKKKKNASNVHGKPQHLMTHSKNFCASLLTHSLFVFSVFYSDTMDMSLNKP